DIPHHHLVALADRPAPQLRILHRRAPHMDDGRLITDDLRHHAGNQAGIGEKLRYSSGCSFRASTPPEMEFRVVSLPPTISSRRLPRNSDGREGRSRVAGAWASMEIKSGRGGCCARSSHRSVK